MLQLKNITKNYKVGEQEVPALKGITLDFRKNEFVCILGPSGCGKTTMMNLIGGLDQYSSGDLLISGTSTEDYKDADWDNYRNKKIGFVFQSYNLISHQSVLSNVELALTISGISQEERRKKAEDALNQVGLQDHLYKKPNQLSGGQMQRVAIARALVNSPDIILADEPTGALDTKTSKQILDLIKEVSKDKLAIIVTHNAELAKKYATRTIEMVDGLVTSDSNPYDNKKDINYRNEVEQLKTIEKIKTKDKKKTSMSFLTALKLSMKNLFTKKGRTILTAIAGSIGIIGIALILAISTGMNNFIDNLQSDTLASNPITISTGSFDINQIMNMNSNDAKWELFPNAEKIFVEKITNIQDLMSKNNITEEYLTYIDNNVSSNWYNDITYKTGLNLNIFTVKNGDLEYSKISPEINQSSGPASAMRGSSSSWQMLLDINFTNTQFDVLKGSLPTTKNEIVLIVDEFNKVSEETLVALGIKSVGDNIESFDFDAVIGKEYKILTNDQMYQKEENNFIELSPLNIDFNDTETLTVVGIIRQKGESDVSLSPGIGYSKELYNFIQEENTNSEIVAWMIANETRNPFTGLNYQDKINSLKEEQREKDLRELGGILLPNEINIYPKNFEAKTNIKNTLNGFNENKQKEEMITYIDMSEIMGNVLGQVVDIISYVLIGFTSISLIVSSIMIGIITYVSVIERTKEIGILRSIGARKKDITRLFNAETFIVGLIAGFIGITITYLLSIPINIIVESLTGVTKLANLSILNAFILIGISIILTVFAGLIPARGASKKDPVLALRTE